MQSELRMNPQRSQVSQKSLSDNMFVSMPLVDDGHPAAGTIDGLIILSSAYALHVHPPHTTDDSSAEQATKQRRGCWH